MIRVATLTAILACAPMAQAHPHIFVDVSLRFEGDGQGNLTGVHVTWEYDDFFSLLIFEDMGLDPDGDAHLTEAELARLKGFDLIEWPDGFEGDLYLYQGEAQIPLDHPAPTGIAVEQGKIVARHYRSFAPVPADGLVIRPYDPTFYVAYEMAAAPDLPGPCRATVIKPDLDAAAEKVEDLIGDGSEMNYEVVEVGIYYADRIEVVCDPSS